MPHPLIALLKRLLAAAKSRADDRGDLFEDDADRKAAEQEDDEDELEEEEEGWS